MSKRGPGCAPAPSIWDGGQPWNIMPAYQFIFLADGGEDRFGSRSRRFRDVRIIPGLRVTSEMPICWRRAGRENPSVADAAVARRDGCFAHVAGDGLQGFSRRAARRDASGWRAIVQRGCARLSSHSSSKTGRGGSSRSRDVIATRSSCSKSLITPFMKAYEPRRR